MRIIAGFTALKKREARHCYKSSRSAGNIFISEQGLDQVGFKESDSIIFIYQNMGKNV